MRNKYAPNHELFCDGIFYDVKRVLSDLAEHYQVKRLCFTLITKSLSHANRSEKYAQALLV
jgi:hypothetical protein